MRRRRPAPDAIAQSALWSDEVCAAAGPSCPVQPERDVRVKRAQRSQITWGRVDLEPVHPERGASDASAKSKDEVPADHAVRAIAAVVDQLDLRSLYSDVRARGETAGASATDPVDLVSGSSASGSNATSDGVGSGREIARLVELHAAYRWLCGGVAVAASPGRLNDFRGDHGDVCTTLVVHIPGRSWRG